MTLGRPVGSGFSGVTASEVHELECCVGEMSKHSLCEV